MTLPSHQKKKSICGPVLRDHYARPDKMRLQIDGDQYTTTIIYDTYNIIHIYVDCPVYSRGTIILYTYVLYIHS